MPEMKRCGNVLREICKRLQAPIFFILQLHSVSGGAMPLKSTTVCAVIVFILFASSHLLAQSSRWTEEQGKFLV